jgi:two-component system phosphate regulon sensor histidine kinase PhoR
MTALGAYLTGSVRNSQLSSLRVQLENEAKIIAEASLPGFISQGEVNDLDALAKKLGGQIDTRITIISLDGTVLGDSHENPSTMQNHATRPEVRDARASGLGESTRYSITLGKQMMYVAVPITVQGEVLGVARVALPLTQVESSVNRIIMSIVAAMAIAAAMVIIVAWLIARMTTRPIRELTYASRKIASGEFGQKISVGTRDESGQLANAFNEMSFKLKEMLATISEDRARLAGILDNMADGVILTDAGGNFVMTNKAAQKLFGIKEEDAKFKPFIEVVREHELNNLLLLCLETGQEQVEQFELATLGRFLRVISIPIANDRLDGVLLLIQDLTELRGLQTMRREMVGNISHEFRTPLAGIKAMVETLQDGAVDDREAAKDFLSRIGDEVDRMAQLVAELTELSRIETGKAELKLELVDLNELVEEVIAQIKPQAERQNLVLETVLADDLPAIPVEKV